MRDYSTSRSARGSAPRVVGNGRLAVVGAGVCGLSCALVALQRGWRVTVISDRFSPDTTSTGAGALWRPVFLGGTDPSLAAKWSASTFAHLEGLLERSGATSSRPGQGPGQVGVSWSSGFELYGSPTAGEPPREFWFDIVKDFREATDSELASFSRRTGNDYSRGIFFRSIMMDSPTYLEYLTGEVKARGGIISEPRRIESRVHLEALLRPASSSSDDYDDYDDYPLFDAVINCAGIAGAELAEHAVGEGNLMAPVRGQTLKARTAAHGVRVNEFVVDLSDDDDLAYVLPRGDAAGTVVLGGTHDELPPGSDPAQWSSISPAESSRIRRRCEALSPALAGVPAAEDEAWAGARPVRSSGVRVEQDAADRRIVHNYGHGGSGMTLHWGCAEDAVALAEEGRGRARAKL